MRQLWKGKLKLVVEKQNPYYGTGDRHLEKVLIDGWFGWYVSLWTIHKDNMLGEYSDWAKDKLRRIFGKDCEIDHHRVYANGQVWYTEDIKWIFNPKYDFRATEDWQVMFDAKSQKYVGYSHRGAQAFGIGDMLFTETLTEKEEKALCMNRKYQWAFLKWAIRHYIKKDAWDFADLVHSGIMSVIPFRDRGSKRIETLEEAFQAAKNFARYIS